MIWVLSVLIILSNGTATGKLYFSQDPQFNNQQDCQTVGKTITEQLLSETPDSRGFYFCEEVNTDDMKKGVKKGSQL